MLSAALVVAACLGGAVFGSGQSAAAERKPKANLWVDASGGSCRRAAKRPYADGAACASIDAAWRACRPGDLIVVKAGTYGPQPITGDKASPGYTVRGERAVTIGELTTNGAFFTLENVVVDVGAAKRAGWRGGADNVTLSNVRLRGPFVAVELNGVSNVRWLGGELGVAGQLGGARVCGQDAEPVQIGESDHVTFDGIHFHAQDADPTPSSCSANGFHLEMIRLDGGTSFFILRDSTFENGDRSGTSSIFITEPGGAVDPHDLTFENNFFGTNQSVGAFNVHSNVTTCRNFTFAYNTFRAPTGAFQCTSASNVRWIGNLGANGPTSPCFGTFVNNVWQDTGSDRCGTDRWIRGARGQIDRLGLGGPDGFRLQPGSPAINAGERGGYCTGALRARDHDGQGRPRGSRCDAGADEHDTPGRGPVNASVSAATWHRAAGAWVLRVTIDAKESVRADVSLVRGKQTLATRTYRRLAPGRRTAIVAAPAAKLAGGIRLVVLLEDAARDQKVVQRRVRAPR